MTWPRERKTIGHLLINKQTSVGKNIGVVFTRGDSTPNEVSMLFISDTLIDNRITAAAQSGNYATIAPLYLYNEIDDSWTANLDSEALSQLTANLTTKPTSIEIFDYIYGILHDPIYRPTLQRISEV